MQRSRLSRRLGILSVVGLGLCTALGVALVVGSEGGGGCTENGEGLSAAAGEGVAHAAGNHTVRLEAPSLRSAVARRLMKEADRARARGLGKAPSKAAYPNKAQAYYFKTDIYERPAARPSVLGNARRGALVPAKGKVYGPGCKGGSWYPVWGGGYVCTKLGALVSSKPKEMTLHHKLPALGQVLPYAYAKVKRNAAELMFRIPTPAEDKLISRAARAGKGMPEVVDKAMKGAFFLALAQLEKDKGRAFRRTVYGRVAREKDLKHLPKHPMHGELLGGKVKLPLAFVWGEDRPVFRLHGGKLERSGVARKHARFHATKQITRGKRKLVRGPGGILVGRDGVRLVRRIDPPDEVSGKDKWVHVDLSQQSLVAYEGKTPVFATVISSGIKGFEPPTGTFRINKKYVSTTMSGEDPDVGWYEVEEVPWTMYYWESYALHGAYWHDDFGKSRSHGCTNIAPVDARWLFYWSDPELPHGWHGIIKNGTVVHVTG